MWWIYILKSKTKGALYVGITSNISRRLNEHNKGKVMSTKPYKPWALVYCEGYLAKEDAMVREKNLKYFGKAYGQLKRRIQNSLRGA